MAEIAAVDPAKKAEAPSDSAPKQGADASDAPASGPKPSEVPKTGDVEMADAASANGEQTGSANATKAEAGGEKPLEDTEMKDAGDDAKISNGTPKTPASAAKASSSKRRSTGVPEHKTKKLNRKKSKAALHLDAKPGDLFLARMKGHQPWPSIICDEDMLPQIILGSRPVTAMLSDGTFKREEYAPGGKREGERTFPIMFLKTNEFAWIANTDLTPITPEECKNGPAVKAKAKALVEAYEIAGEGHDLEYFKNLLLEHQQALDKDAEEKAEREREKAEKAERAKKPKGKRKSEAPAADEDEMEVDEDGESKPKSKKRKKSIAEDGEEKAAKTPKTSTKLKLTTPKTPAEASAKKKTPKAKASAKKSGKASGSEEEAETPKVEAKPLSAAEAKEKKEKEIRYYRHKLQKGFLSRDNVPGDEEVEAMSAYLSKLEGYPDLEGSIIRATKIHKVLKAMIRLPEIPRNKEFKFKERSHDLLGKWNTILGNETVHPAGDKDADTKSEGDKEKKGDEAKANGDEAEAEKKEEDKPIESVEKKSEEPEKPAEPKAEAPAAGEVEKPAEAKPAEAQPATAEASA